MTVNLKRRADVRAPYKLKTRAKQWNLKITKDGRGNFKLVTSDGSGVAPAMRTIAAVQEWLIRAEQAVLGAIDVGTLKKIGTMPTEF